MRRLSLEEAQERVQAAKLARALNRLADYSGVPRLTTGKMLKSWRIASRMYSTGRYRRLRPTAKP